MAKDLGQLTQRLFEAKEKKSELSNDLRILNQEIVGIETELLHEMQSQGLYRAQNQNQTVYISRQVVPKITDWDAFYAYIKKHDYFHMLERRPSKQAYREQYENGQAIPGVEPVVFDELRTRKA